MEEDAAVLLSDNVTCSASQAYFRPGPERFFQAGRIQRTGTAKLANFGGGVDYSFGYSGSRFRPYVLAQARGRACLLKRIGRRTSM